MEVFKTNVKNIFFFQQTKLLMSGMYTVDLRAVNKGLNL